MLWRKSASSSPNASGSREEACRTPTTRLPTRTGTPTYDRRSFRARLTTSSAVSSLMTRGRPEAAIRPEAPAPSGIVVSHLPPLRHRPSL